MKAILHRVQFVALVFAASLVLTSCGKSVQGSTYADANGALKIEFQSGGKAVTTIAGLPANCTYIEESKSITLTCEGQPVVFTLNDDGSLSGPAEGMLAGRLTKQ
jgi:hypothetical protein